MVHGRIGCNENRDFVVRIYFATEADDELNVVEQMAEKEATEIFKKLKEELLDKKKETMDISVGSENWCLVKSNIIGIRLFRN